MAVPLDHILGRVQGLKRNGSSWMARCPAHEDSVASLSIGEGHEGCVLLKCFAGCELEKIVAAMGLEVRDLFPEPHLPGNVAIASGFTVSGLAADKGLPEKFLRNLGVEEYGTAIRITYRLEDSRMAPRQRIRTAVRAKDGSRWSQGSDRLAPYGLWRLGEAGQSENLVLVEGESDCWTLWFHQVAALGIPGAGMGGTLQAVHLADFERLYVVQEPDAGGDSFVAGVARRLEELRWQGNAYVVHLPAGIKDPNDLHKRDPNRFLETFQDSLGKAERLEIQNRTTSQSWQAPIPLGEFNLQAFPTGALPAWLAEFVKAEAVATQTPEDLAAMVSLAVMAAACVKKFEVEVKPGWREPVNVFTVTALPPGNRKSAVFRDAVEPLEEFEQLEARR